MLYQTLLLSSLVAGSAFASVEQQQPFEEIGRAIQQAKRVAILEKSEEFPARAFLLGQRVAQNAKTIAYEVVKPETKRQKKLSKNPQHPSL
ncbi:MAG: hypothetical protein AB7K68_08545 [Bacteriovoracia bacterium]